MSRPALARAEAGGASHGPVARRAAASRTSLRGNLAWTISGNAVYAACQWGMLVALARLGTPETVGDFALALALTAPIVLFAMLNLRAAQATDRRGEFAFADYVHLRLACLAGAALALVGVLALGRFDRATAWVVALIGVAKAFDAMSDVVYGLLQRHEWMRRIAVSRALQGVLQLAALVAVLSATGSLVAAAAAMAATSAAVTLSYDVASVRRVARRGDASDGLGAGWWRARPAIPRLHRLALLALPLGIAAVLDSLASALPRYALDATSAGGREALGYYAAIAYFVVGQGTLLSAVADVARPRLARLFLEAPREFAALTARLLLVAGGIACAGLAAALACGGPVLRVVYGDAYADQSALFAWMMAAAIPWNLSGILTTAVAAAREFRALSLCFAAMTVATGVAALVLAPRHGAIGAAWAVGIGMLVRLATAAAALWRATAAREPAPAVAVVAR
jgi:O-antigen/teichoic acid export membrane protein